MNKTERYRLNQWDMSDRIEMKDFNADNAAIEAALSALSAEGPRLDAALAAEKSRIDAALAAEGSRLDAALAAEKSRIDAALAAAKTELSNAIATEKSRVNTELAKKALASDLTAQVSRLESGKLEFATLLDTTFTASGSTYPVTVPGSEIGKCAIAAAILPPSSLPNNSTFHTNTESEGTRVVSAAGSSYAGILQYVKERTNLLVFFPMKQSSNPIYGISIANQAVFFFYSPVTYSALTRLMIKVPSGTSTLSGSGTLRIYGIR